MKRGEKGIEICDLRYATSLLMVAFNVLLAASVSR
jgi:hypothetical protein